MNARPGSRPGFSLGENILSTMITISGNLGDNPELTLTPNGKPTTRLRVAVDSRHRSAAGEWVDGPTSWYTVIAWDRLAENIVEHGRKGDRVLVHGRLEQREWTTDAGENRAVWEITAEDLGLSFRLASPAKAEPVAEQPRPEVSAPRRPAANRHPARTRA
jgi:single-strand DNA-binding protein